MPGTCGVPTSDLASGIDQRPAAGAGLLDTGVDLPGPYSPIGGKELLRGFDLDGVRRGGGGTAVDVRVHQAEVDRLDSLASYDVLDTGPDAAFDAVAAQAAQACRAPVAAVMLVAEHRQWAKASYGFAFTSAPREQSFCSDAVASATPLVVDDTSRDPRYQDNPLVTGAPGIRAYAGVPIIGREGLPLGAVCAIDTSARPFTDAQLTALGGLALLAAALLDRHRADQLRGLLGDGVLADARDPARLRRALDAGELAPHYQPVVDTATGRPHSVEALLRWQHPTLGCLPPSAFLPGVEGSALVVPVGRAVLGAALSMLTGLHQDGVDLPGGVAVNVASGQLARPGLSRDVLRALDHHGLPAHLLSLEITETTALPDPILARRELGLLAEAGVHVVIDDFGVGWSNLARVLELPVDRLKLDRSLAGRCATNEVAAAMVRSTLALAQSLDLAVVAEGVETEQTRRLLAELGCRWSQGWLFSPAVPGPRLAHALRELSCRAEAA